MKEIREVSVINKAERRFLKYITEHDNKLEKKNVASFSWAILRNSLVILQINRSLLFLIESTKKSGKASKISLKNQF